MKSSKVICLGEALVDRLGPIGGDPNSNKSIQDCLGGAPANVACGLAKLGTDVAFIGCVGNDKIGDQFENLFISRGINIMGLQRHQTIPTRIVLVKRDLNGERSFGGFVGSPKNAFADHALNLEVLKNKWFDFASDASCLVLGTILLAEERSREVVRWTCDQAMKQGMNIAIDLNWRPTFWDQNFAPDSPPNRIICSLVQPFLEKASLLKLAKEEAYWFFKTVDPYQISKLLPSNPSVVITDGSNPIHWILGDIVGETKASSPTSVVDTTGAGDSFMSGLISGLLSHSFSTESFSQANKVIRFAAACGALVCCSEGAIEPQPSYLEVEDFLSSVEKGII